LTISDRSWKSLDVPASPLPDRDALFAELAPVFSITSIPLSDVSLAPPHCMMSLLYKLRSCLDPSDLPFLTGLCRHPWTDVQIWAIDQILAKSGKAKPEALLPLLDLDWPEGTHFRIMKHISWMQPPACYRRIGRKVTDLGELRPRFSAYLIRMLAHPSVSRRLQAMVILADGLFYEALEWIAGFLSDQTEIRTTDWDDIPDSLNLLPEPNYPYRTKVSEYADDALVLLDMPHSFESGWLKQPYVDHDSLKELITRTLLEPSEYPKSCQLLAEKSEASTDVQLFSLICQEQHYHILLDESVWLPFLSETNHSLIYHLVEHLQARHRVKRLSYEFGRQLLDAEPGKLQGLGLWLLAESGWPEAQWLAFSWLDQPYQPVPRHRQSDFIADQYRDVLPDVEEKKRWALLALSFSPQPETITKLLQFLRATEPEVLQLSAAHSLIELKANSCLKPLLHQLKEDFPLLSDYDLEDSDESWVPQLKILEVLGNQSHLPIFLSLIPTDTHQSFDRFVMEALYRVLQSWGVDASHPLLSPVCEHQLDALEKLEPLGPKDEACPGRHTLADFLAEFATREHAERLLPILVTDSLRLTPKHQRSKSLEKYLVRILQPEDLDGIEPILHPQNGLTNLILSGLSKTGNFDMADILQKLLARFDWPENMTHLLNRKLQLAQSMPL
jgi:hypothetical protein